MCRFHMVVGGATVEADLTARRYLRIRIVRNALGASPKSPAGSLCEIDVTRSALDEVIASLNNIRGLMKGTGDAR